jgi:hypothetical protein
MIIDYSIQKTFSESLILEDIGNCAIYCQGSFRDGKITLPGDYYIIIKTVMGKTKAVKWGPMMPDLDELPNTFKLEVKTLNYKETAIVKEIQGFINDGFKGITQASEITIDEALTKLPQTVNFVATLE